MEPQVQEVLSPEGTRKSKRPRKRPERLGAAVTEDQQKQLSPKQRRKRKSQAQFGLKKTLVREAGQWKVGRDMEGEEVDREEDICGNRIVI